LCRIFQRAKAPGSADTSRGENADPGLAVGEGPGLGLGPIEDARVQSMSIKLTRYDAARFPGLGAPHPAAGILCLVAPPTDAQGSHSRQKVPR